MDERKDRREVCGAEGTGTMIRVSQIKMPIGHTEKELLHKTAKLLRMDPSKIRTMRLVRKSIDARKKPEIFLSYTVDVEVAKEDTRFLYRRIGRPKRGR